MRRLLPLLVLILLAAPAAAHAADSHAPHGARLDWLPTDTWVMSSWLPYDEARLDALTDTTREERRAWLDDRHSLGALARSHGWKGSMRSLAQALVAPRLPHVPRTMRRALPQRALDTLTQPHLGHHVLFHVFHTPAIPAAAPRIFGMSPAGYRRLRNRGLSPSRIGRHGGRNTTQVQTALASVLRARGRVAVRSGAMSRLEAQTLLSHQTSGLREYVLTKYRTPRQQVAFLCRLP